MYIEVSGIKTHYLEINPRAEHPLVLLHGWKSSARYWKSFSKLLPSFVRIILLDLPGFGTTQAFQETPNIPHFTEFINQFTQNLGLKKFIIAGHSFGGLLAMDYVIKNPKKIISLIVVAPAVVKEKPSQAKMKIRFAEIARPIFSIIPNNHFEKYLGWYTPRDYKHANEYQQTILKKIVLYDLKPLLSKIMVPTDIIWGKEDFVVPNIGEYLRKKISNSHLHIINGSGHLSFLTHPKELASMFNQAICKQLQIQDEKPPD